MLFDAVEGLRAYLASSQLAWLFATVAVYCFSLWLYEKAGQTQLLNPILVSVASLSAILWIAGVEYADYFSGAQFIHFLLGPVTVMLAVPLYKSIDVLRRNAVSIPIALLAGSLVSSIAAVMVAWGLGSSEGILRSLAAKSVTTPIALGITEAIGGFTPVTAVVIVITGVIGGIVGDSVFRAGRIVNPEAQGFALGLTSHGIGIGRALQIGTGAAAFASLAMCLNGLVTALWVPAIIPRLISFLS